MCQRCVRDVLLYSKQPKVTAKSNGRLTTHDGRRTTTDIALSQKLTLAITRNCNLFSLLRDQALQNQGIPLSLVSWSYAYFWSYI